MPVCLYCLNEHSKLTRDHVFARSWYPDSTPPNIEKWEVPSCDACNNRFSQLEDDVRRWLAMCLDRSQPAAAGIVEKAFRSIDPNSGRSQTDGEIRHRKKIKLFQELHELDKMPSQGVLSSFRNNWEEGSRMAILIPAEELDELVKKWVRGMHYITVDRMLPLNALIEVLHLQENAAREAFKNVIPYATRYDGGPGIQVIRATAEEPGEAVSWYAIELWQQFKVYAYVEEKF